jgi:hypothetical protein
MRSTVLVLLLLAGCTAKQKLTDVVTQGRALMRDPAANVVTDKDWQLRRVTFLANCDTVAPEGS